MACGRWRKNGYNLGWRILRTRMAHKNGPRRVSQEWLQFWVENFKRKFAKIYSPKPLKFSTEICDHSCATLRGPFLCTLPGPARRPLFHPWPARPTQAKQGLMARSSLTRPSAPPASPAASCGRTAALCCRAPLVSWPPCLVAHAPLPTVARHPRPPGLLASWPPWFSHP